MDKDLTVVDYVQVMLILVVILQVTVLVMGKERFEVSFKLVCGNPRAATVALFSSLSVDLEYKFVLRLLNPRLDAMHLNRPLTFKDLDQMVRMYNIYRDNIVSQHNELVLEWLDIHRLIKRQQFVQSVTGHQFSKREALHKLKRALKRHNIPVKLQSKPNRTILMVNSQIQPSAAQSKLEENETDPLEQMMAALVAAIEKT